MCTDEELYSRPLITHVDLATVADFLEKKAAQEGTCPAGMDIFSERLPTEVCRTMTMDGYAARLLHAFECNPVCAVTACIYLARAEAMTPSFRLGSNNVHRAFFAALLLAIKATEEFTLFAQCYAMAASLPVSRVADLQWAFADLIRFDFSISELAIVDFMLAAKVAEEEEDCVLLSGPGLATTSHAVCARAL